MPQRSGRADAQADERLERLGPAVARAVQRVDRRDPVDPVRVDAAEDARFSRIASTPSTRPSMRHSAGAAVDARAGRRRRCGAAAPSASSHQLGVAGRLDHDVEAADLLRAAPRAASLSSRRNGRRSASTSRGLPVVVGRAPAVHTSKPVEPQDVRREHPDRACAEHERAARPPRLAAADRARVADPPLADRRRLGEHAEPRRASREGDELLRLLGDELPCEPVQSVIPRSRVVAREAGVGRALGAGDAVPARAADGRRDEVAAAKPSRRSTVPRNSWPSTSRSSPSGATPNWPSEISRSVPQTPTSSVRIRISPSRTDCAGTSATCAVCASPGRTTSACVSRSSSVKPLPVEVAIQAGALLGEGPRWDAAARRLLWVDIEGRALHLFDPESGDDRAIALDNRVGAAAPMESGGVLVALADRLAVVDLDDESVRTLVEIPHGTEMRMNDGACDPAGRFWVGSVALDFARGAAALYRYSGEGGLDCVLEDVTISNGLGWSPDGSTMYYVDSMAYRIDRFDFDVGTGAISDRRPFAVIERGAGIPDGLAVDDDGGSGWPSGDAPPFAATTRTARWIGCSRCRPTSHRLLPRRCRRPLALHHDGFRRPQRRAAALATTGGQRFVTEVDVRDRPRSRSPAEHVMWRAGAGRRPPTPSRRGRGSARTRRRRTERRRPPRGEALGDLGVVEVDRRASPCRRRS